MNPKAPIPPNSPEQHVFVALAAEYWNKFGYSTRRMAQAAANALASPNPDLDALVEIIERNLKEPNFVAMAREVVRELTKADELGYFIVDTKYARYFFVVAESGTGGWFWESFESIKLDICLEGSQRFEFPEETYQDAIRHAHKQDQKWLDSREERETALMADLRLEERIAEKLEAR